GRHHAVGIELEILRPVLVPGAQVEMARFERLPLLGQRDAHLLRAGRHAVVIELNHASSAFPLPFLAIRAIIEQRRGPHNGRNAVIDRLLPTTVVGSYVQPDWLVDRDMLRAIVPPRVRAQAIWRIPETQLEEAQDAATLAAIRDMERAGIDIITDGEIRRESYSNRFATALDGVDIENPAEVPGR